MAGIGLFITLIGLSSAGLIVSSPATLVSLGDLHTPNSLIAILGIILIAVFTVRNVKGGIFLAVIISAIVGFFFRCHRITRNDTVYATIIGAYCIAL